MLEYGNSAGQALCNLLDPTRRQRLELLAQIDKPPEDLPQKKVSQKKGKKIEASGSSTKKGAGKKKTGGDEAKKGAEEELKEDNSEKDKICRDDILLPPEDDHQNDSPTEFNLICYGLPNVVIGVQGK